METICEHGVTVKHGTDKEQLDDLVTGSLPRLTHLIRCWKPHPVARKLARQMTVRLAHQTGMSVDDATKRVRQLTGLRRIWGS